MIAVLTLYLLCVICSYVFIRKEYSSGGHLSDRNPNIGDFIFIFMPFINTLLTAFWVADIMMSMEDNSFFTKFFRIKK